MQPLPERDMIQDGAAKGRLLAPTAHDWIVACVLPQRRGGVREIWNVQEQVPLLFFAREGLLMECCYLIADLAHAAFQIVRRFPAAAFAADLFAQPLPVSV